MPVCVGGMHRSGTSMVARMLNLCGLYLGGAGEMKVPSPDNRRGYWEHERFVAINREILRALGGAWDYPPPPAAWATGERLAHLREPASALMREFDGHEPWGWKDPRNSLTLPFWLTFAPRAKVVICLRNPLEVAVSLRRRRPAAYPLGLTPWRVHNALRSAVSKLRPRAATGSLSLGLWGALRAARMSLLPGTADAVAPRLRRALGRQYERLDFRLKLRRRKPMSYRDCLNLWMVYNERLLAAAPPSRRIITHYHAYFTEARAELRRLREFLDLPAAAVDLERGCASASGALRHHRYTTRDLRAARAPAAVLELYRRMCEESGFADEG